MRRHGWLIFVAVAFLVVGLSASLFAPRALAGNKHCVCPPPPVSPGCVCAPSYYQSNNKLRCLVYCDIDDCSYVFATCN